VDSRHSRSSCRALSSLYGNWRVLPLLAPKHQYRRILRLCPYSQANIARTLPAAENCTCEKGNERQFTEFIQWTLSLMLA